MRRRYRRMRARWTGYGASGNGLFRAVKKRFGTTDDLSKIGWILPDGSTINLGEEEFEGRSYEHANVDLALPDAEVDRINRKHGSGVGVMWEMMDRGAMRVQWGDGEFFVEHQKRPTDQQKAALRKILRYTDSALIERARPDHIVDVWREWGKRSYTDMNTAAIINWMSESPYQGLRGLGARKRNVFERAIKEFGTTDDPREAGYILPGGEMLDFSGKREGGPAGDRAIDHRAVERLLPAHERSEAMLEFMRLGAIRMQSYGGELYLDIAEGTKPSHEQLSTIRQIAKWHDSATVEYTNPEHGHVEVYRRWGTPDESSVHIAWYNPSSILQWIRHRSLGYEGLGKVVSPEKTDSIFYQTCKEIGHNWQAYEPYDSAFILPDGCLVKLDTHENIASYYPDEIMDTFHREYEAVHDYIQRGAIRTHWDGDMNAITFEFHKKPTSAQKKIVREMSSWVDQIYIDVQGEEDPQKAGVVAFDVIPIFRKADAAKVVRYMGERGYGQRVARPAGTPRGRLKFHWNAGAFYQALDVAESCSGPIRKVCKTERTHGGEVTTCTWRDSRGRIVASAAGIGGELEDLEREGVVGRRTSLWTDRDLLDGRCPA